MEPVASGEAVDVPYTLRDMADGAVAVMGAVGWASARVVGTSMGGMIARPSPSSTRIGCGR